MDENQLRKFEEKLTGELLHTLQSTKIVDLDRSTDQRWMLILLPTSILHCEIGRKVKVWVVEVLQSIVAIRSREDDLHH
jgi:hypothetical protein